MLINELTDLDCEACGEAVDLTADDVELTTPLLCGPCLVQLVEDEGTRELLIAA